MSRILRVILAVSLAVPFSVAQASAGGDWTFAVSGDSRNCGDVVMPAIAKTVLRQPDVAFYWHLGDFRLMSGVDDDMRQRYADKLALPDYWRDAWGDFIANQVVPFGSLPVYLGIGNHELAGNKSESDFLNQFAYWIDRPELRAQRLNDSPDGTLKAFYHWKYGPVDFINLDNSGPDGFEDEQMTWFESVLARDKADTNVKTIVVGMHRALPNSNACGHSMNGDADRPGDKGTASGRRAYLDLVNWEKDTNHRYVYILASHSHFYMPDLFETPYWKNPAHGGTALPGWIVGTAGARRYPLPQEIPADILSKAKTKVAGYLLGTVHTDGKIDFSFKEVNKSDVPEAVNKSYDSKFVESCFVGNYDEKQHPRPPSCDDK